MPNTLDAQSGGVGDLGQLSSGKAAELAGLSRAEFLEMCGRYRAPVFNYAPDEIEDELRSDLAAARGAAVW